MGHKQPTKNAKGNDPAGGIERNPGRAHERGDDLIDGKFVWDRPRKADNRRLVGKDRTSLHQPIGGERRLGLPREVLIEDRIEKTQAKDRESGHERHGEQSEQNPLAGTSRQMDRLTMVPASVTACGPCRSHACLGKAERRCERSRRNSRRESRQQQ